MQHFYCSNFKDLNGVLMQWMLPSIQLGLIRFCFTLKKIISFPYKRTKAHSHKCIHKPSSASLKNSNHIWHADMWEKTLHLMFVLLEYNATKWVCVLLEYLQWLVPFFVFLVVDDPNGTANDWLSSEAPAALPLPAAPGPRLTRARQLLSSLAPQSQKKEPHLE